VTVATPSTSVVDRVVRTCANPYAVHNCPPPLNATQHHQHDLTYRCQTVALSLLSDQSSLVWAGRRLRSVVHARFHFPFLCSLEMLIIDSSAPVASSASEDTARCRWPRFGENQLRAYLVTYAYYALFLRFRKRKNGSRACPNMPIDIL
jgi:hypothetical protein